MARAGTAAEKDDVKEGKHTGYFEHTCAECVSTQEGCSIEDAHRKIKQPRTAKQVECSTSSRGLRHARSPIFHCHLPRHEQEVGPDPGLRGGIRSIILESAIGQGWQPTAKEEQKL